MEQLARTDKEFDEIYPDWVRELSYVHWTPMEVAELAVSWLAPEKGTRVLDIGAGVGKFCIIGSMKSAGEFYGLELRTNLAEVFRNTLKEQNIERVHVINDNVMNIDFRDFDAFYYYNPFCEHIAINGKIDETIEFSEDKYRDYEDYVIDQLDLTKKGTRIVTYCSERFPLPASFDLKDMFFDGQLALWEKVR